MLPGDRKVRRHILAGNALPMSWRAAGVDPATPSCHLELRSIVCRLCKALYFRSRVTLRRRALQCFTELKNSFRQIRAVLRREDISTLKLAGVGPQDIFSVRFAAYGGLSGVVGKTVEVASRNGDLSSNLCAKLNMSRMSCNGGRLFGQAALSCSGVYSKIKSFMTQNLAILRFCMS